MTHPVAHAVGILTWAMADLLAVALVVLVVRLVRERRVEERMSVLEWIAKQADGGVTIERQFWDEAFHEWRPCAYSPLRSTEAERRYFVAWGSKMGHFAVGDTLEEALANAMKRCPA